MRDLIDIVEKAPALPGPGDREAPAARFIRAATHASSIATLMHALPGVSLSPAGRKTVDVTLSRPAPGSRQETVLGHLRSHLEKLAEICRVSLRFTVSESVRQRSLMLMESKLEDMKAQLVRLKVEQKKLAQNGPEPLPRIDWNKASDDDARKFDRRLVITRKVGSIHGRRTIDLNHEIDLLKARITAEALKGDPRREFTAYTSQKTGYKKIFLTDLGQMIHTADMNLEHPASTAIDMFVGHPASDSPGSNGMTGGIMQERRLEDAFSDAPSESGSLVRQQLEKAFAPIKEKLRAEYGNEIIVHRSQCKVAHGSKRRHVLSWTVHLELTQSLQKLLGGEADRLDTRSFPLEDIVWITDRANQAEFIMLNRDHPTA